MLLQCILVSVEPNPTQFVEVQSFWRDQTPGSKEFEIPYLGLGFGSFLAKKNSAKDLDIFQALVCLGSNFSFGG